MTNLLDQQHTYNYFMRSTNVSDFLPIAKSSLFKIVHDSKVGAIVVNNQYYVRVYDLLNYIQEQHLEPIQALLIIKKNELLHNNKECVTDDEILAAIDGNKAKNIILSWIKRMKPRVQKGEKNCYYKEDVLKIVERLVTQKEKEYQRFQDGFAAIEEMVNQQQDFVIYQMPSVTGHDVCIEPNIPYVVAQNSDEQE